MRTISKRRLIALILAAGIGIPAPMIALETLHMPLVWQALLTGVALLCGIVTLPHFALIRIGRMRVVE